MINNFSEEPNNSSSLYHVSSFLIKLFEIVESKNTSDIICWNSKGESFIIKDLNQFTDTILPKYFKHKNYSSFIRQLNMYDFHKCRAKPKDQHEFQHPFFLEGKLNLLPMIKRKNPAKIAKAKKENNTLKKRGA